LSGGEYANKEKQRYGVKGLETLEKLEMDPEIEHGGDKDNAFHSTAAFLASLPPC